PDGSSGPVPRSATRTFALALGALILFVPANVFPTLTVTSYGSTQTATVFGGVVDLWQAGMWPLAIIVVCASLLIPFFKIIGLMFLTLTLDRPADPHARTRLYLVIAQIGRWSMLDVYVISLLVAVLHFGALAQAQADIGSLAFVSVVIVTLLAARSFDPRLIWQHQTVPPGGPDPRQRRGA
ncbi:MAG: paraquat-inducible protein A, partial [Geminicoccaceae bacterium]